MVMMAMFYLLIDSDKITVAPLRVRGTLRKPSVCWAKNQRARALEENSRS
jgi:hypothetical protein